MLKEIYSIILEDDLQYEISKNYKEMNEDELKYNIMLKILINYEYKNYDFSRLKFLGLIIDDNNDLHIVKLFYDPTNNSLKIKIYRYQYICENTEIVKKGLYKIEYEPNGKNIPGFYFSYDFEKHIYSDEMMWKYIKNLAQYINLNYTDNIKYLSLYWISDNIKETYVPTKDNISEKKLICNINYGSFKDDSVGIKYLFSYDTLYNDDREGGRQITHDSFDKKYLEREISKQFKKLDPRSIL